MFNCLYGVIETLDCFLSTSRKICGSYGGPQIAELGRRCAINGESALDGDLEFARSGIGSYRLALQPLSGRISSRLGNVFTVRKRGAPTMRKGMEDVTHFSHG